MMDDRLARLRESKAAYDAEKRAEAEAVNAAAEKARADGFEDGGGRSNRAKNVR